MSDVLIEVARLGETARNNEKRINDHEDICAKRYTDISGSFVRVHERLDGIARGIISVLITVLIAIIAGGVGLLISILMKSST